MELLLLVLLIQPPGKSDPAKVEPPAKPSLSRLLPKLKDLTSEQQGELKKLNEEYDRMIAELEAERDSKLALVLSKDQRENLNRLLAEEIDRYRVVLRVKFNRPNALFKPLKDIVGYDANESKSRLDAGITKPLAENLTKAKAEALLKAITGMGAKAVIEKQE